MIKKLKISNHQFKIILFLLISAEFLILCCFFLFMVYVFLLALYDPNMDYRNYYKMFSYPTNIVDEQSEYQISQLLQEDESSFYMAEEDYEAITPWNFETFQLIAKLAHQKAWDISLEDMELIDIYSNWQCDDSGYFITEIEFVYQTYIEDSQFDHDYIVSSITINPGKELIELQVDTSTYERYLGDEVKDEIINHEKIVELADQAYGVEIRESVNNQCVFNILGNYSSQNSIEDLWKVRYFGLYKNKIGVVEVNPNTGEVWLIQLDDE